MTGNAARFERWLREDADRLQQELNPPVQLSLITEIGDARERPDTPHDGDPDGLESIGSILRRWVDELYAKQQAAA